MIRKLILLRIKTSHNNSHDKNNNHHNKPGPEYESMPANLGGDRLLASEPGPATSTYKLNI